MPNFGEESLQKLQTCHVDIIRVMTAAINVIDFKVIWGFRNNEEQQRAYDSGHSKAKPGQSKHNRLPSYAIDIAPYPIDWKDINRFRVLAGFVLGVAYMSGVKLRWGGDWNKNFTELDEKGIRDFGHFEIVEE